MMARVFPFNLYPPKAAFPFLRELGPCHHRIVVFGAMLCSMMSLEASNIPAITNSFTALALAPGVLKTTIPFWYNDQLECCSLCTALATALRDAGSSISCIENYVTE